MGAMGIDKSRWGGAQFVSDELTDLSQVFKGNWTFFSSHRRAIASC